MFNVLNVPNELLQWISTVFFLKFLHCFLCATRLVDSPKLMLCQHMLITATVSTCFSFTLTTSRTLNKNNIANYINFYTFLTCSWWLLLKSLYITAIQKLVKRMPWFLCTTLRTSTEFYLATASEINGFHRCSYDQETAVLWYGKTDPYARLFASRKFLSNSFY